MSMRKTLLFLVLSCVLQACGDNRRVYQGYVASENTYISSKFDGRLLKFLVKKGDKVAKGDLLYILDTEPHNFYLSEAKSRYIQAVSNLKDLKKPKREPYLNSIKAKIKQVESQITLAKVRVQRNQTLYDRKVLAKDSLDAAIENLNQLLARKSETEEELSLAMLGAREDIINAQEANIHSFASKIRQLEWIISETKGYAPVDGYVYDTYYVKGELVRAAVPVLSLINHKNIYLEFFVPYRDLKNLHVNDSIWYKNMGEDVKYNMAKVTYISPKSEYIPPLVYSRDNMDKIVFRVKAEPVEGGELTPGLPVTIMLGKNHAE